VRNCSNGSEDKKKAPGKGARKKEIEAKFTELKGKK